MLEMLYLSLGIIGIVMLSIIMFILKIILDTLREYFND